MKIEAVVADVMVAKAMPTIEQKAKTGKIFFLPRGQIIRIRTGEAGDAAI